MMRSEGTPFSGDDEMSNEDYAVIDSIDDVRIRLKGPNPISEFLKRNLDPYRRVLIATLNGSEKYLDDFAVADRLGLNDRQQKLLMFLFCSGWRNKMTHETQLRMNKVPGDAQLIGPIYSLVASAVEEYQILQTQLNEAAAEHFGRIAETQERILVRETGWKVLEELFGEDALLFGKVDIDQALADPDVMRMTSERYGKHGSPHHLKRISNMLSSMYVWHRESDDDLRRETESFLDRQK